MFAMRLKWVAAFALVCGMPALAGPILLNNTGIYLGSPITGGSVDTSWILQPVLVPPGNYPAYVVTSTSPQFSEWRASDATSQWIAPRGSYTVGMNDTVGNWVFETTFDLTGMLPGTAFITGQWLADNHGIDIYLNGAILSQTTTLNDFTNWSSFSLPVGSNFGSGLNTLDFVVLNQDSGDGGPVGLRVEFMEASASEIPEPATFGLLGVGLLGLGLASRRRKSA